MGEDERRLYVANIPADVTQDELRETFELYGPVEDIHLNKPTEAKGHKPSQRSAFIGFEKLHDATAAMLVLSEMFQFRENHHAIFIRVARPRGEEGKGYSNAGSPPAAANSAPGPPHAPPAPPPAPQAQYDHSLQQGRSYAPPAPPAPPGRETWGRSEGHYSQPDHSHAGSGGDWQNPSSNGKGEKFSGAPGTKLWVGSLPGDVTQQEVEKLFAMHGRVADVNLMPVKSRSGQACAFVHLATPQEADACLAVMQAGVEIRPGDGPIQVERPGARKGGSEAPGGKGDFGKGKPEPYGKPSGKSYGKDYGKDYGKNYGKDYGKDHGKSYGKDYGKGGKDYGKAYHPY